MEFPRPLSLRVPLPSLSSELPSSEVPVSGRGRGRGPMNGFAPNNCTPGSAVASDFVVKDELIQKKVHCRSFA